MFLIISCKGSSCRPMEQVDLVSNQTLFKCFPGQLDRLGKTTRPRKPGKKLVEKETADRLAAAEKSEEADA